MRKWQEKATQERSWRRKRRRARSLQVNRLLKYLPTTTGDIGIKAERKEQRPMTKTTTTIPCPELIRESCGFWGKGLCAGFSVRCDHGGKESAEVNADQNED